jgi:hypothetical protein
VSELEEVTDLVHGYPLRKNIAMQGATMLFGASVLLVFRTSSMATLSRCPG